MNDDICKEAKLADCSEFIEHCIAEMQKHRDYAADCLDGINDHLSELTDVQLDLRDIAREMEGEKQRRIGAKMGK